MYKYKIVWLTARRPMAGLEEKKNVPDIITHITHNIWGEDKEYKKS